VKCALLGRTGVTVSRLCPGCMSYGDPAWRRWMLDEAAARPFFRRAVELGINFFDTADVYSLGASEEVAGRALPEFANLEECSASACSCPKASVGGTCSTGHLNSYAINCPR
jgi:1-deoxyxylulose-5-phosphate synthase